MKIKLLTFIFLLLSTLSYCQDFKKKHVPRRDRKLGIYNHYHWNDSASIDKIDLLLFADERFQYRYINFIGDTLNSSGEWKIITDTLYLKNDLSYEKLVINANYLDDKKDYMKPWNLLMTKDLIGREYRHAMVWINNHKMGCMGGMGACITGEGFEDIDSVQIQLGKTFYSNWLRITQSDCDIQIIIQTTDDLRNSVFLGDKEFIIKRRKLILEK